MNRNNQGFSLLIAILVLIVAIGIGFGAWYVSQKRNEAKQATQNSSGESATKKDQINKETSQPDPSEGGKFLVISEWGVRAALPTDLHNKITYSLGEVLSDPDGNQIQAAKLFLKNESSVGNECAITQLPQGEFIDTGAQLLRVEKDKPFNTQRYRWTFKEKVLTVNGHVYHLNYVTPDCMGSHTASQVEELQVALERLLKIE